MIRALAVLVAIFAFAATLAAGEPTPGGSPGVETTYASEPRELPGVCPGPEVVPVGDLQSGDDVLDSGSSSVELDVWPSDGEAVGRGTAHDEPAVSIQRVGSGDIAGLAGLTCVPASQEQWLVGGSTALGSSARLVLSNPAATGVRAHIELFSPLGQVGGTTTVVVPPGGQEDMLLEAVEPESPAIAVRITAGGAGVAAALQDSRLDGFTPAGSDWAVPTATGTRLVVPIAHAGEATDDAVLTLVSVEAAAVEVALATEDGSQAWLGSDSLVLEPGVVTEIAVPAPNGIAAITITSDAEVSAAVRTSRSREAPTGDGDLAYDFAWTSAQVVDDQRERATVVPEGDVSLVVFSSRTGQLEFEAAIGPIAVDLVAGRVTVVDLDVPAGTRISSSARTSWGLLVTDSAGFVTTLEPVSTEVVATDISVSVGPYAP